MTTPIANTHPIIVPAHTAVLLLFMPAGPTRSAQRNELIALSQSLQKRFNQQRPGGPIRVLRIDEAIHPDVVQSFGITRTPAFVLVRQGVELWREDAQTDEARLVHLTQQSLGVG